jgi:hypothetical protein
MDNKRIEELLQRLQTTEQELAAEIDRMLEEKRRQFHYTVRKGRVTFERNWRQLQRRYRQGLAPYILGAPLRHILTAPVIYAMIVPIALLDLTVSLYQAICFRAYRIPRVRRSNYLVIDRHQLPYLNAIEKLNCVYCGYGNGVMAYAREIVARTEQYWCPIKHARRVRGMHPRTGIFFEYGDAEAYREGLKQLRRRWDEEADL